MYFIVTGTIIKYTTICEGKSISILLLTYIGHIMIVFIEKKVNIALSKVNCRKSSGPDQLCDKVIKECQLHLFPCDTETLQIINE